MELRSCLKNILISCIYQTPGPCIDTFNKNISELYDNHNDKLILVCDFKIDLLKSNNHTKTTEFVNTMFSMSFYPLILKPSRITRDSAILIDNIFVNLIDGKIKRGLLMTDVSDHLHVFAVLEMNNSFNLSSFNEPGGHIIWLERRHQKHSSFLKQYFSITIGKKFMWRMPMILIMHFWIHFWHFMISIVH